MTFKEGALAHQLLDGIEFGGSAHNSLDVTESLASAIVDSWTSFDVQRCLGLLEKTILLHTTLDVQESPLLSVASAIQPFQIRSAGIRNDLWGVAHQCLDAQAEILWLAAALDPSFSVPALKALVARKRTDDAVKMVPLAQADPKFPTVAIAGFVALFDSGDPQAAVALLRDRLTEPDCCLNSVTELVKLVKLTDLAGKEFDRLIGTIHRGARLTAWEVVYFGLLGIAIQRQPKAEAGLNALAAKHGSTSAERLARAALLIDQFDLRAATRYLQQPLDTVLLTEWRNVLQAALDRLATVHVRAHQWQAARVSAKPDRPKVALTLSGFVRGYDTLLSLFDFLLRHVERWDIELFAQTYERLGDLYTAAEDLSSRFYDYSHGGFYREIVKTAPLKMDLVFSLLSPVAMQIEPRHPDNHYIQCLGMAHPQWLAVWESYCLFERHRLKTGADYRLVIRGRYDRSYDSLDLDRLELRDNQIVTPSNEVYGSSDYHLCDQLAVGPPPAMHAYCSIGDGRNFRSLEETDVWKDKLQGRESSHEAHLALWLSRQGIEVFSPQWLRSWD